jgi:dimeric dUTPase (all-alpha-NTP-PPase superfamily)
MTAINFVESKNNFAMIVEMLENQLMLNTSAYANDWHDKARSGEWSYTMAAIQEVAEFNKSSWLPWWSKAERDWSNSRIELVDALHFMLSEAIASHSLEDIGKAASDIHLALLASDKTQTEFDQVELVRRSKVLSKELSEEEFKTQDAFKALFELCTYINFSFDKLYALYLGKSVLNKFRQQHGYKEGKYSKIWETESENGKEDREDNYFLAEWVGGMNTAPTIEQVKNWLANEYQVRILKNAVGD